MPEITVIVPVYNAEKQLNKCIESILAQTLPDFELILVNDGSHDGSGSICDHYAKQDSRIKVIHQCNQGQAVARNNAITIASGKWFHFVDSDDWVHPQTLELLYRAATENKCKLSYCDAEYGSYPSEGFEAHREYNTELHNVNEDFFLHLCLEVDWTLWVIWAKLIHRDLVVSFPFEPGRIYEDSPIVCKWLKSAGQVVRIPQKMYFYYDNAMGTMKSAFSPKRKDWLWSIEEQIHFYTNNGYLKMSALQLNAYLARARGLLKDSSETTYKEEIARYVKKHVKMVYRRYRNQIKALDHFRFIEFREIAFPTRMSLYWRVLNLRDTIRKRFSRR